MSRRTNLQDRYELRDVLGRGGMGVVYKAFDTLMKRDVALKTILDIDNPGAMDLFYKEWGVLATMVHPNVISIYDVGEFQQEGVTRPFFVMPLLPGVTLDKLIRDGSPRLTVECIVDLISQSARGLYAAHERGLVHRDVKPSNIFVMDDDSVKIIDFGVAHLVATGSKTSLKGTLFYIAPEQLQMKPPSPMSDLFALAVVCFESLTRRRPFQGSTDTEVIESILRHTPPSASDINPQVRHAVSQVVHKALAKQPFHRFNTVREFGETLQKALRNEPLEFFDSAKTRPRLERARQSFEQGDYAFAAEILSELEGEGHLDQEITLMRRQVDQAVRQSSIRSLMESARRCFEAQEYPLALRKIQEALDLDPEAADALALKSRIEKQSRENKIDEWIQLARRHLDNNAFQQAREALDNAIKLKPNETQALHLMNEVDRRERELQKAREEKSKLYQEAMRAWDKGEVTSALSKLEGLVALDKKVPESDTGRSNSYQTFYNQVRSEYDAIKNSYDEARHCLSTENFEGALAICRQYLTRYPNHSLFQALKFDVEERQRQNLSARIAETDRRAEEEPDLDKRLAILEEVGREYPGEPHFERAINVVRDKRDLVNSIVAKAGFYEERGQLQEALDQWQILRSIHEKYPGLSFEVERLGKRRDQQAREDGKARWVEQVDRYMLGGDYDRAASTIESALAEFPGDAELLELEKLAGRNLERAAQAFALLSEARDLSDGGAVEESLDPLRQAHQFDPLNTVVRTVLVNSLVEHARRLVDSDWEKAEPIVGEVLGIEPNHSAAQSLLAQISDRKREEFTSSCLAQARRLQTEGDLDSALDVVQQGMVAYPKEARLLQLHATLRRTQTDAMSQRPKEAPPAARVTAEPPPPAAQPAPSADETIVTATPAPAELPPIRREAQAAAPPFSAPAAPPGPSGQTQTGILKPSAPEAPTAPTPPKPVRPVSPRVAPGIRNFRRFLPAIAGLGAATIVFALFLLPRLRKPAAPPAPATHRISLRASVAGAAILVDGQQCGVETCVLDFPPGTHRAEARLIGYQPAAASFEVAQGQNATRDPVVLNLAPLAPLLSITSDLTEGAVTLDGQPVGQLQGGSMELSNVGAGQHALALQSGGFRASLNFEVTPGVAPKLTSPVQVQSLKTVVVTGLGPTARLFASTPNTEVTVDGIPAGTVTPEGLEITGLQPGTHELVLSAGAGQPQKMVFEVTGTPILRTSMLSDQNLGSLRVVAGEDNAAVYLNGEKYRRQTQRGRLLIFLFPRKYAVRVEKDGFLPLPEQVVELRKGEEARLEFKLIPAPQKAALAIRNAVPGSDVLLDGAKLGSVHPDGTFSASNLEPGRHTVSIRRDRFKLLTSDQQFAGGKTVEIEGTLESTFGTLRVEISPPGLDVRLRLRREGESQDRPLAETTVSLSEGVYTVTGSAPGYQDYGATVHVFPNRTATASIALRKPERPSLASPRETRPAFALADLERSPGWTREGASVVRRGGDYTLLPVNPAPGNFLFTILLQRGRRIEWVLNYRDEKNHVLFQVENDNFKRIEVVNGKRTEMLKAPHRIDHKAALTVLIAVNGNSCTTSFLVNQQWRVIDSWEKPGGGLVGGRFGFHVPGRDQIALSDFRFTAN